MSVEVEKFGEVKSLEQGKKFLKLFRPLMTVRCYVIDGLLIDSGLYCFSKEVLSFAKENKVHSSVLTHHHEDHSGNGKSLQNNGIRVLSSAGTKQVMKKGFERRFYQRIVWDKAPQMSPDLIPKKLETNRFSLDVIEAPGHCDDQIILHEPTQGWLFTGDAFLSARIKYFREDEDFYKMMATVEKVAKLSFEQIFCAHHPVLSDGKRVFEAKLRYLKEVEEKVWYWRNRGLSVNEITRRVLGRESSLLYPISFGDFCKKNLIKSILFGPKLRKNSKPLTFCF